MQPSHFRLIIVSSLIILFSGVIPIDVQAQDTYGKPESEIKSYRKKKRRFSKYFQGNKKKRKYFEGWYYKMVSADGESVLAIIPGVALGNRKTPGHAFVQVINGNTGETSYHKYPLEDFSFDKERFEARVGPNYFREDSVHLAIGDSLYGDIALSDLHYYPSRRGAPGIMGWYRMVPFMQTYHGVLSLDHKLDGKLTLAGKQLTFDEGRGYIEKDWGHGFPSAWIWMQSNHFQSEGTSFMLSVARIPWLGKPFTGFLGFFLHEGKVYRFATYTNAKIKVLDQKANSIHMQIREKEFTIDLKASRERSGAGVLAAPVNGAMEGRVAESLDANIEIKVTNRSGDVIYEGNGGHAGLEMAGDLERLLKRIK